MAWVFMDKHSGARSITLFLGFLLMVAAGGVASAQAAGIASARTGQDVSAAELSSILA